MVSNTNEPQSHTLLTASPSALLDIFSTSRVCQWDLFFFHLSPNPGSKGLCGSETRFLFILVVICVRPLHRSHAAEACCFLCHRSYFPVSALSSLFHLYPFTTFRAESSVLCSASVSSSCGCGSIRRGSDNVRHKPIRQSNIPTWKEESENIRTKQTWGYYRCDHGEIGAQGTGVSHRDALRTNLKYWCVPTLYPGVPD